jgi:Flp pilus assembly protein TadD
LLEEVGQSEQAKAQLVDALTIDPHNARALSALGRLRDQSGDHVQALTNYQRSLQLNRFQPEVAARVAQLQGAVGAPITTPPTDPPTITTMQPTRRY